MGVRFEALVSNFEIIRGGRKGVKKLNEITVKDDLQINSSYPTRVPLKISNKWILYVYDIYMLEWFM